MSSLINSVSLLFPFLSPTHYLLEIDTSKFFRETERGRERERKDPCGFFSSFFFFFLKVCHPTAALLFAFLLGSMSKSNIKSYPPLQPPESKKYVILMTGARPWVIRNCKSRIWGWGNHPVHFIMLCCCKKKRKKKNLSSMNNPCSWRSFFSKIKSHM